MSDNEWYTPEKYIQAAKEVMGNIDLDPASCELANQTVQAATYYSKDQDGLSLSWHGRIWLNPPYGRINRLKGGTQSYQKLFAEKLLQEYKIGNIEQAIILSLGNPNCGWFQPFYSYPICFYRGTIHFNRPDGSKGHFGFPLAFIYLGLNEKKFIHVFSQFGRIVKAVN